MKGSKAGAGGAKAGAGGAKAGAGGAKAGAGGAKAAIAVAIVGAIGAAVVALFQFVIPPVIKGGDDQFEYVARVVDDTTYKAVENASVTLETQGVPPDSRASTNGYVRFSVKAKTEELNARVLVEHPQYEPFSKYIKLAEDMPVDELRVTPRQRQSGVPLQPLPGNVDSRNEPRSKKLPRPSMEVVSASVSSQTRPSPTKPCPNGGVIRKFYRDQDRDGFGSGNSIEACTPPDGFSENNRDCYDSNGDAKPGQNAFFESHRGDASFDYDCDGEELKEKGEMGQCGQWPACDQGKQEGWKDKVPACGNSGVWLGDCDYRNLRTRCVEEVREERQRCK